MPHGHHGLAPYACLPPSQCSRLYPIPEDPGRSPFQRDCDRIVHAAAFRRLMHKTQVFVAPEGDHFRTRLTHTIEVSRVARSLATTLGLNADLADAVALAHDLGHPPFGHAGEEELAVQMEGYGGFEHNAQAIRIVTRLERSYIKYDGLNLSRETLEGIAKHNGPVAGPVPFALAEYNRLQDLDLHLQATGEAQAAAAADDIAYICHDLQDGIRAGMFTLEDIASLPIIGPALQEVAAQFPGAERRRVIQTMLRRVFKELIGDVVRTSRRCLEETSPGSADDIKSHGDRMIGFSARASASLQEIRQFLHVFMYHTGRVQQGRERGEGIVRSLFQLLNNDIRLLPEDWQEDAANAESGAQQARVVADFIAGMTDNYAMTMHAEHC